MACPGKNRAKVYTRRDRPRPVRKGNPKKFFEHITLLLFISAIGCSLKPILIFPLKREPLLDEWDSDYFIQGGSSNGWMDTKQFRTAVEVMFVSQVNALRSAAGTPKEPVLLLLDGASTRLGLDFKELKRQNIHILFFPAHSSHLLQPLDLSVFGELKAALSERFKIKVNEPQPEKRRRFAAALHRCLLRVINKDTILTGFERTGLFPLNPSIPLSSRSVVPQPPQAAAPMPAAHGRKRKQLPMTDGALIDSGVAYLSPASSQLPSSPKKIRITKQSVSLSKKPRYTVKFV